jgi:hypothetical protein
VGKKGVRGDPPFGGGVGRRLTWRAAAAPRPGGPGGPFLLCIVQAGCPAPALGLALPPPRGPVNAHAPFLSPASLLGGRRTQTRRSRFSGCPPHFRLGLQAPPHRSTDTGLAGPAAEKLQLPAGSARVRTRVTMRCGGWGHGLRAKEAEHAQV